MKVSSRTDAASLHRFLRGEWVLARDIDDRQAGQRLSLAGSSSFAPHELGLLQHDRGEISLPDGQKFYAEQRYLWRFGSAEAWIDYADGRPFIALTAPFDGVDSTHLCGEDHYSVRFDFSNQDQWHSIWTVRGPRKNYVMHSTYSRV